MKMKSLVLYYLFSIALEYWTLYSVYNTDPEKRKFYAFTVVGLIILTMILDRKWKEKENICQCVIISLIFIHIGASLAYRMQGASYSRQYFGDTVLMSISFLVTYLIIRYTSIYQWKKLNLGIIAGLPVILVLTRIYGQETGGAYISFFGLLIFSVILTGYPFAAAYFLSKRDNRHLKENVRSMPLNQVAFLGYTFLLYVGCALCNEFGSLLVIGITSTFLFYLQSRNMKTKFIYSGLCVGGALLASGFVSHINERVYIWMHLAEIDSTHPLAAKAGSVLYIFQNLPRTGFWGDGMGSIPDSIYPTLNTDHVLVAFILEYSLFFALGILLLSMRYISVMLAECYAKNRYDYILNLSCGLIIGAIILINVGSSLGSFITAGIGFPYISAGTSVNVMIAILTAIHCGIYERGQKDALSEENASYEN